MQAKRAEMRCKVPLRLHFDGPGVDSHTMRVQELAPALLALNELIQEVNNEANEDTTSVQLYVKAFEPGSFGIELFLDTNLFSQVMDFLSGKGVSAVVNAHALVGILFELFALKKWLEGQKPTETKKLDDNKVELKIEDRKLIVDAKTFNIYFNNTEIQDTLNNVVAPLGSEGIDKVDLSSVNEEFQLTKKEYDSFVKSPSTQEFSENLLKNIALQIKSPYFEEEKKWKVLMGGQAIFISIDDEVFMKKVLSGEEEFSTGDVLVADVLLVQTIEHNKIVNNYRAVRVIEHKRAPRQLIMPL